MSVEPITQQAGTDPAPGDMPAGRGLLGSLTEDIGQVGRYFVQSFRLMVGVPDYGSYVAHVRATHPDREPMSYEAFFVERQAARYGTRNGRCC